MEKRQDGADPVQSEVGAKHVPHRKHDQQQRRGTNRAIAQSQRGERNEKQSAVEVIVLLGNA
jgi:hypothetical protein